MADDATVKRVVETATQNYREVKAVTIRGGTAVVTVEKRMLNNALPRFLANLQKMVKSRFGYGLIVEATQDDKQHWDPNFERTPGVGGRLPTVSDE